MSKNISPIIITGMHRSGTSLLAKLAKDLGLFAGTKLDPNCESIFFQQLNIWLLQLAGANWSNPIAFNILLNHRLLQGLRKAIEYL